MLRAANITGRENYIMFSGDSRIREQFHELVDSVIGVPRTYFRKIHMGQEVTVERLRFHAVRFCRTSNSQSIGLRH